LPEGSALGEAAAIKAAQGDALALAVLAQINSPRYRLKLALIDAGIELHPGWRMNADHSASKHLRPKVTHKSGSYGRPSLTHK
jgi:hypothetical protein